MLIKMSSSNQFQFVPSQIFEKNIDSKPSEAYDAASKSTASSPVHISLENVKVGENDAENPENNPNILKKPSVSKNKKVNYFRKTYAGLNISKKVSKNKFKQSNHDIELPNQSKLRRTSPNSKKKKSEKPLDNICLNCGEKASNLQDSYCPSCYSYFFESGIESYINSESGSKGLKRKSTWLNYLNLTESQRRDSVDDESKNNSKTKLSPLNFEFVAESQNNKNSPFKDDRIMELEIESFINLQAKEAQKPLDSKEEDDDKLSFQDAKFSLENSISFCQNDLFNEIIKKKNTSRKDIHFQEDIFSFQGDKPESLDSWEENDFDYKKSEKIITKRTSSQKQKSNSKNLLNKKVEIIELLSDHSDEKPNEISKEKESPQKMKVLSKENKENLSSKEGETEKDVDDIINFFIENSSKNTMLFQHEPVSSVPIQNNEQKVRIKTSNLSKSTPNTRNNTKEMKSFVSKGVKDLMKPKIDKSNREQSKSLKKTIEDDLLLILFRKLENNSEHNPSSSENQISFQDKQISKDTIQKKNDVEINKSLILEKPNKKKGKNEKLIESKKVKLQALCNNKNKIKREKESKDTNIEQEEKDALSVGYNSDDSEYILFGDDYDIMLECYSHESEFVDIFEVKRRMEDFESIGINSGVVGNFDSIIYPKKNEIRVGSNYQAQIPLLNQKDQPKKGICRIWDPERIDKKAFIDFKSKLSFITKIRESTIREEKVAQILIDHNFNVDQALKFSFKHLEFTKKLLVDEKKTF